MVSKSQDCIKWIKEIQELQDQTIQTKVQYCLVVLVSYPPNKMGYYNYVVNIQTVNIRRPPRHVNHLALAFTCNTPQQSNTYFTTPIGTSHCPRMLFSSVNSRSNEVINNGAFHFSSILSSPFQPVENPAQPGTSSAQHPCTTVSMVAPSVSSHVLSLLIVDPTTILTFCI